MSQGSLDFGRLHRVDIAHRQLLRILTDAVEAVGLHQAAGACDARSSELADALARREHRYMRVEWVFAICDIAPPDFRIRIADALVNWLGLRVEAAKKLKPEERLARLEERIAKHFGPAGAQLVEENRR